jgi:hypothetical protein
MRHSAAVAYNALTLPLARVRLAFLARAPHEGVGPLPHMAPAEAARPTVQSEGEP